MSLSDYERAETSNIDYKVSLEEKKPKSWLKSVSAFAILKVVLSCLELRMKLIN